MTFEFDYLGRLLKLKIENTEENKTLWKKWTLFMRNM
jgi:hypothetical protein